MVAGVVADQDEPQRRIAQQLRDADRLFLFRGSHRILLRSGRRRQRQGRLAQRRRLPLEGGLPALGGGGLLAGGRGSPLAGSLPAGGLLNVSVARLGWRNLLRLCLAVRQCAAAVQLLTGSGRARR